MVAVLVIALLMISVFRFVKSVLQAVRISTDVTLSKQEVTGLMNYLQVQLEDLPVQQAMPATGITGTGAGTIQLSGQSTFPPLNSGTLKLKGGQPGLNTATASMVGPAMQLNTLSGTQHKYGDHSADEMEWVCAAGQGTLTTSGEDQYRVVLAIQNVKGKSNEYEIGLRRRPIEADEKDYNWLPLLRPAAALEIRYFEPRGKQWIDAWKEPILKPSLVRVRVWRTKNDAPVEAIFALPAARMQGL